MEREWQAAYCAMGKDRFWGIQSAPIPRAGPRQVASGVSWLMGAEAADRGGGRSQRSRHQTAAADTGGHRRGPPGRPGKPRRTWEATENLWQDKGYDCPTGRAAVADGGCRPQIRHIGEEKLDASGVKLYPARPWVVEHTLVWLSRCRAILVSRAAE